MKKNMWFEPTLYIHVPNRIPVIQKNMYILRMTCISRNHVLWKQILVPNSQAIFFQVPMNFFFWKFPELLQQDDYRYRVAKMHRMP